MARKTLGGILKELNSAIPNVENLDNNEAAPWLFVPQRGEDAAVRLDDQQDLRVDADVTDPKSVIGKFASSYISENKDNDQEIYLNKIQDENALRSFEKTKQSSLQTENGTFGNALMNFNSNSLLFGSKSREDLNFLNQGAPINITAKNSIDSKLSNANIYSPDNIYIPLNSRINKEDENKRSLYTVKTYRDVGNGANANFDKNVATDVNNIITAKRANEAVHELLVRATRTASSNDEDGFLAKLLQSVNPNLEVVQTVNDLSVKYSSQFDKIKDDLNANEDIMRTTDHNFLLTSIDRTYGAMNSPDQPFEGFNIPLIVASFAGMASITALSTLYSAMLSLICQRFNQYSSGWGGIAKLFLGSLVRIKNELGFNSYLTKERETDKEIEAGLSSTYAYIIQQEIQKGFLYNDFYVGLKLFYGVTEEDGNAETGFSGIVINPLAFTGIFNSPGFYAVIARGILRDAAIIADIASGFGAENDVVNVGNQIYASIEKTLNSFSFAFFTKLVIMGIQNRIGSSYSKNNNFQLEELNLQETDSKDLSKITFERNYYSKINGKNALSLQYFASQHLLSRISYNVKNDFNKLDEATKHRYSKDQVESIEAIIDSDYMPFSIQDVRTNEVISLPAFIDSVSESFSPSYETTNGYGRTDPIYTYSKTDRSIDLSFSLVAFNIKDHDHLYYVLNKIVSMCYPQYTRGEERISDGKKFIQPFSQIQAASPLVRIRLGDLVSSNKSSYAIRNIFGANENLKIEASNETRELILNPGTIIYEKTPDLVGSTTFAHRILKQMSVTTIEKLGKNKNNAIYLDALSVQQKLKDAKIVGTQKKSDSSDVINIEANVAQSEYYISNLTDYQVVLGTKTVADGTIEGAPPAAEATTQTENRNQYFGDEELDPKKNAVVLAFDSTHGKGMAGFITSLSLQYDGINWGITSTHEEDKKNNSFANLRAPTRVKISMTFSPVHDMPLGLDYTGKMIAPSHPVGSLSSNVMNRR